MQPKQESSSLFEHLPIGAYRVSVEGHVLQVNQAFLALHRAELPAPVDGYVAKRTVQLGQRVAVAVALRRRDDDGVRALGAAHHAAQQGGSQLVHDRRARRDAQRVAGPQVTPKFCKQYG